MASQVRSFPAGVLVINLDHRQDRWNSFLETQAPKLEGLAVERISAVQGTQVQGYGEYPYFRGGSKDQRWAARGGCILSHRKALRTAVEKGWQEALILEDDVALPDDSLSLMREVSGLFQEGRPKVVYFGYTDPVRPYLRIKNLVDDLTLYRVYGCNTAHAYLINIDCCRWILGKLPGEENIWPWVTVHRAIDRWYYRNLSRRASVYALSRSKVMQKEGHSDIVGKKVQCARDRHKMKIKKEESTHPLIYNFSMCARMFSFRVGGLYDRLRGYYKRARGF